MYAWEGLPEVERRSFVGDQRPPDHSWGCTVSEDFVLADLEITLWFSSPREMVAWFLTSELPDTTFRDPEDKALIEELLNAIVDELDQRQLPDAGFGGRLREALAGWQAIGWFGSFEDLCSGGSEIAQGLRSDFRSTAQETGASAPLSAHERQAFADYLHVQWRGV